MKRCLACNAYYAASITDCPDCGFSTPIVDGFPAYAPDFAHGGGGFKSDYFANLTCLEDANFWFRSRNRLILWALKEYCPNFRSLLEIGCGTGYVLSGIAKTFPEATVHGSEIFTSGLGFASSRLPSVNFMQMDAREIPFKEEFEVIGVFDVLEHIEEDEIVLQQIYHALEPGGIVLITVPQHRWLWSAVDEYACHVRRYEANELHQKVCRAGFDIIRSTSFVTTLLPAMYLARLLKRNKKDVSTDAIAELRIHPVLNKIFESLLNFELALIRKGITLPWGGSRLVVARKPVIMKKD
jgi:SAM-dependent methyltransferase